MGVKTAGGDTKVILSKCHANSHHCLSTCTSFLFASQLNPGSLALLNGTWKTRFGSLTFQSFWRRTFKNSGWKISPSASQQRQSQTCERRSERESSLASNQGGCRLLETLSAKTKSQANTVELPPAHLLPAVPQRRSCTLELF